MERRRARGERLAPFGADHAPLVAFAREPDVEALDLEREAPVRVALRLAAEEPDRHLDARKLLALELERVDARQQVDRGMRDEPGVQEFPDVAGRLALPVPVVVRDEVLERGGVARLGGGLGRVDKRTDLVLRRAGRTAGGKCEEREKRELTQGAPPTAATRR